LITVVAPPELLAVLLELLELRWRQPAVLLHPLGQLERHPPVRWLRVGRLRPARLFCSS
jgi:hypothetical protein